MWFPLNLQMNAPDDVKKVCAHCPVSRQCLSHAITTPETVGIWAGTTPSRRMAMRRKAQRVGNLAGIITEWLETLSTESA